MSRIKYLVILLLLILPRPVLGSIAFVTAVDGGNNGGSTTSLTFAIDVGSGSDRGLVVGIIGDTGVGNDDISSVTFNGDAMSFASKVLAPSAADGRWTYIYVLSNPDSGSHNVVITAGSSHYLLGLASAYTGVYQSDTMDGSNTNTLGLGVSPNILTTSVTTTADNCWGILIRSGFTGSSVGPTASSGSTIRTTDAALHYFSMFDSNGPQTPAGALGMSTIVLASTLNGSGQVQITWAPAGSAPASIHTFGSLGVGK